LLRSLIKSPIPSETLDEIVLFIVDAKDYAMVHYSIQCSHLHFLHGDLDKGINMMQPLGFTYANMLLVQSLPLIECVWFTLSFQVSIYGKFDTMFLNY